MARIAIPESVYQRSRQEKRGSKQAAVLREYVEGTGDIPQGHEVFDYDRAEVEVGRDGEGRPILKRIGQLFAITQPFVPSDPEIPPAFKKRPRRG